MDKKKKKNSGNWNNQKKNQQNIENNNASNRSKEFRFDNSNYQNPDYEKQKQKAINEIKAREIICPKCNMPITDVSSAMADKVTGKPVHFDCVLAQLKQNERVGENEKIAYIGQGRFAVLYYENPRDQKKFVIKKIIEWEDRDQKSEWRDELSGLYSQVR